MSASAGPLGSWNMNQEGVRSSWEQSCVGWLPAWVCGHVLTSPSEFVLYKGFKSSL